MRKKGLAMLGLSVLSLRLAIGLVIFSGVICGPIFAQTDVIAERKANFKANAAAMRAMNAALGGGDFETVITRGTIISDWARAMPNYFPENSNSGDTKARAEIWMDFDDFKNHASANEEAALTLISTAKTGDVSATFGALKALGGTCKSCHGKYKD